jgi:hypothetical protein
VLSYWNNKVVFMGLLQIVKLKASLDNAKCQILFYISDYRVYPLAFRKRLHRREGTRCFLSSYGDEIGY